MPKLRLWGLVQEPPGGDQSNEKDERYQAIPNESSSLDRTLGPEGHDHPIDHPGYPAAPNE
jgi:hypothetical protein